MTLNWNETASDCAVAQTFAVLLDGQVWHDCTRWYTLRDGQWKKSRVWQVAQLMREVSEPLLDNPYWKRTRHRLGMSGSQYMAVRVLQDACRSGLLRAPEGFYQPERHPTGCLCVNSRCTYSS